MARATRRPERQQTRQLGNLALLVPAPPAPASPLGDCLSAVQRGWQREGHLAALWQAWPRIAGPQLAPHCRPLRLAGGLLTVGAAPGPWLLALRYNRHQLLAALRAAGFTLRDLRVEQALPQQHAAGDADAVFNDWQRHPSRVDVHGMAPCPACGSPAPAGEMARWGHCSFCCRARFEQRARPASVAFGSG